MFCDFWKFLEYMGDILILKCVSDFYSVSPYNVLQLTEHYFWSYCVGWALVINRKLKQQQTNKNTFVSM